MSGPLLTRSRTRQAARMIGTIARQLMGRSDVRRWSDPANLLADWDARTIRLAAMIPPQSRVLEFGAGRMILRHHLPPGCSYIPSDIVKREADMLVCDLNAPTLPDLPSFDVGFFSGVLEYVHDLPRLLAHLHARCDFVVASYAFVTRKGLLQRARRRRRGWINDYAAEDLIMLFLRSGFYPLEEVAWRDQLLFKFKKQHVQAAAVRDA